MFHDDGIRVELIDEQVDEQQADELQQADMAAVTAAEPVGTGWCAPSP